VVLRDTSLEVAHNGMVVVVVVRPKSARELDWLRRETRERAAGER
jgi:hypothetical protein